MHAVSSQPLELAMGRAFFGDRNDASAPAPPLTRPPGQPTGLLHHAITPITSHHRQCGARRVDHTARARSGMGWLLHAVPPPPIAHTAFSVRSCGTGAGCASPRSPRPTPRPGWDAPHLRAQLHARLAYERQPHRLPLQGEMACLTAPHCRRPTGSRGTDFDLMLGSKDACHRPLPPFFCRATATRPRTTRTGESSSAHSARTWSPSTARTLRPSFFLR